MKYSTLPNSDLKIPGICLGANNFGTQVSPEDAKRILDTAFELGVNMVDSADVYTQGKSEEIIGSWAKARGRSDVIIATKVGAEPDPDHTGLSKENIQYQVKQSLERLGTDYIDLYYVHRFDEKTPLDETLEALNSLVKENKVRYIACSNFSAEQVAQAKQVSKEGNLRSFIANQIRYNILQRDNEKETIPFCFKEDVGVLAYSPLRSGLLAGRYERGTSPPAGSRGSFYGPDYMKRINVDEMLPRAEKLKQIADEAGTSLPVLAVSWILHNKGVNSAIVGASRPDQFEDISKASDTELSAEIIERINQV